MGPCAEGREAGAMYREEGWARDGGWNPVWGGARAGALYRDPPPCRMTDTTGNITFPQLHWRAVTMNSTEPLNVIDTLSSIVGKIRAEFNCQIHFT